MKGRVRNENGTIIWEDSGRKGILLENRSKELLTKERCNVAVPLWAGVQKTELYLREQGWMGHGREWSLVGEEEKMREERPQKKDDLNTRELCNKCVHFDVFH